MAVITGTSDGETLVGTGADDQISGLGGNDLLIGGGGTDILNGGLGNDTFIVDSASDQVIEAVGEGNDAVYAAVNYSLAAGQEIEILSAYGVDGTTPLSLTGNSFAQTLVGNAGNNLLIGGGGTDIFYGLGGNDTYVVDSADDLVIEYAGQGTDTIYTSVSYALTAGQEIEVLDVLDRGAATALNLTGNAFSQALIGNAGANLLIGGGGADTFYGLGGNDIYVVDSADDQVMEAAGGGNDTVLATASYTLTAGQQIEVLDVLDRGATTALTLTGNVFAQTIIGNAGANLLSGGGGADIFYGLGGNDTYVVDSDDIVFENAGQGIDTVLAQTSYTLLVGQEIEVLDVFDRGATSALTLTGNALAQTIIGNAGNNFLIGGGGADIFYGLAGNDTYVVDADDMVFENGGQGIDTVLAQASYTLITGQEIEVLDVFDRGATTALNLTGNGLAQTIIGNAGNNFLIGGGGADIFYGLAGNDTYLVDSADDLVIEGAGQGNDAVYAAVSYALAAGQEIELLSAFGQEGTGALSLTGNAFAQALIGNAGSNVLDGGAGADVLYGLGGSDFFAFTTALGAGNIDSVADFVAGTDKIQLGGAAGQPFVALATGSLRAGAFVIGTAALDADDYLIYNSATGALLYDADGLGGAAAVQFATLSTGLSLTAADFIVSGAANTAPAITSGATASIAENSNVNTVVYQTVATDADGDRITYSLTGTDAALLTIDANGAVRLITAADFETKTSYSFNVVASDSGVATTKAVTLTITDVSDGASTPIINETAAANDSIAQAQVINPATFVIANNPNLPNQALPSATIVGNLPDSEDRDFFAITLQAGERLILDVDFSGGNLDSFLRIYGPNGSQIGSNDDQGGLDPGSAAHPGYGHNTDSTFSFRAPTSGTYYFSIESFQDPVNHTFGTYEINVSVGPPATPAQILAEDVDALISGTFWDHPNLTYGFPASASVYPQGFDEVSPADENDDVPVFEPFSAGQITATQALLQLIANVSVLTFQRNTGAGNYLTPGSAAAADLRFAESDEAEVAYAYYPNNLGPGDEGGSAWFNHTHFNTPIRGNYAWMGILHEIGHALGLKHGHEPPAISADHDSVEYSVMTYRSYPGAPVGEEDGGYVNEQYGYPQTLMMLDIAALQKIYGGANYSFNSGNSTYTWDPFTGEMSINGTGQGAPGNGVGGSANRVFMTIWDGGGTDTYDLSAYGGGTTIDLRPGEWTTTSQAQLANLNGNGGGGPIYARGNVANALLYDNDPRSLIENAIGGAGADTLIANQAANSLRGNGGADIFKWMSTGDAGTGGAADTVADFLRGTDKIDLSNLDANPALAGQQDFSFVGTGAFTNVAGQVRYDVTGGNAHIFADVDGNGTADMQIILTGITTLAGSDFNF